MATGCYTEPYLPASFKGVTFRALDTSSEHGRRGAEGEFPFGERTAYADLGRKIRRYTIAGRFDGNDHVAQAGLLIAAVEERGPGQLLHPTRGVIPSAACTSLRVRDNPDGEQGVTYVDLEFVEANEWPNGLTLIDAAFGVSFAALLAQVRASFVATYQPSRLPTFFVDQVIQTAQNQISEIANRFATATATQSADQTRNRRLLQIQSIAANDNLAQDPENVERAIVLGMTAIAGQLEGVAKFDVFRDLANNAAQTSGLTGTSAAAENAVFNLVRTTAAIFMAEATSETTNTLANVLFDQTDAVVAVLEGERTYARDACDNLLFAEIDNFAIATESQLNRKAFDTPGLVEFDFGGSVHPLVAAYDVYGDAKRVREIENLNVLGRLGRVGPTVTGSRLV